MSSLKMTFSLASLVLLIAFIAMPVMAHVITPADTGHNPDDNALNPNHALVESITVDTTHLTTTNVITATVTFAAASGTSVPYSADPLVVSVHEIVDPADIISTGSIVMEIKDATTGMFGSRIRYSTFGYQCCAINRTHQRCWSRLHCLHRTSSGCYCRR